MDDFDIEDVGRPAWDDIVGYDNEEDANAAKANAEMTDYEMLLDEFGDKTATSIRDPDTIDTLTFVPRMVDDFKCLKLAMLKMCENVAPDLMPGFICQLISGLTKRYHSSQLELLREHIKSMRH